MRKSSDLVAPDARNGRAALAVAAIFAGTSRASSGREGGRIALALPLGAPLSRAWCRRLSGVDDRPGSAAGRPAAA